MTITVRADGSQAVLRIEEVFSSDIPLIHEITISKLQLDMLAHQAIMTACDITEHEQRQRHDETLARAQEQTRTPYTNFAEAQQASWEGLKQLADELTELEKVETWRDRESML